MRFLTLAAAIGAALLLFLGSAVWLIHASSRGPASFIVADVLIGTQQLQIDSRFTRSPAGPLHRSYDDLDLLVALPDFSPAGERAHQLPLEALLTITLRPKDIRLEPRDKVARLFARYLETKAHGGDGGLVMRRFQEASPFAGEEIFMTPPEGRLFWARCSQASSDADAQRRICLSEIRYGALDLRLRFSAIHLAKWEELTASTSQLLASLSR
jgi:hypothetical protein